MFVFLGIAFLSMGIHGDPFGGNKNKPGSVFGTYTGTFEPAPTPTPTPIATPTPTATPTPGTLTPTPTPTPALIGPGIFTLDMPKTNRTGVGTALLPLAGRTYPVFLRTVVDPKTRVISGLIDSFFPVTGGEISITVGRINASGHIRVKGSATVTLDQGFADQFEVPQTIEYDVSGSKLPKSSATPTATPTPAATPTPTPIATTLPASDVDVSTATLNAIINPKGSATIYFFEYGPTGAYGTSTAPGTVTGSSIVAVNAAITGLNPGTLYHFRINAVNGGGTVHGGDVSFTTSAPTPTPTPSPTPTATPP